MIIPGHWAWLPYRDDVFNTSIGSVSFVIDESNLKGGSSRQKFWLGGTAPRPPNFWLGGQSPLDAPLKRSFVTFDRGSQTGPPRSNDFFFWRRWRHTRRPDVTSGRTSGRMPADDRDFCLVQGYLRTETIDKRNIAIYFFRKFGETSYFWLFFEYFFIFWFTLKNSGFRFFWNFLDFWISIPVAA